MKKWLWILMIVGLAACGSSRGEPDGQTSPIESIPDTSPLSTPTDGPLDPARLAGDLAQKAIVDLAERLSIDSTTIQIERVESNEFPAQGLGCAEPESKDVSGDQPAFVTGQSIWLRVGDARYEYRSHGTQLVFCGMQDS